MFNSKKHSIHVKLKSDIKNLNMINAISRISKKVLNLTSNNTYLKDNNKLITYNNLINKEKASQRLGNSIGLNNKIVKSNNTHMSYLMNNINIINLNNNIGLKQGILLSYNKII